MGIRLVDWQMEKRLAAVACLN